MKTLRLIRWVLLSSLGLSSVGISADAQTPFNGAPVELPGSVSVVRFDNGGEGVAYHDADVGNTGGAFRTTDVDIDSYARHAYYVGWTEAGEWLEYSVNVRQAGVYILEITLASDGAGGALHIEFDGIDKTGPIQVPDTGGWRNFATLAKAGVQLDAGPQILRIALDSVGPSGSVANLIGINVVPSIVKVPGTIEMERFDDGGAGVAYHDADAGNSGGRYRSTDVDIGGAGSFHYIGWTEAGEWLKYAIDVQSAGHYLLRARVMSQGQGGTFHVEFNGVDKTGPIRVPDTGSWTSLQWIEYGTVYLDAGVQTMRLVMDSIGPSGSVANFDFVELRSATPQAPLSYASLRIPGTIEAEHFDNGGEGIAYHDADPGNNGSSSVRTSNVDIDWDGAQRHYIGWTEAGEWLSYTVNVDDAGYYRLDVLVASQGAGGTFHIEMDGVDKTGPINVGDTGGWRVWQIVRTPRIYLEPGSHIMRLAMDSIGASGSVANIDWLRFTRLGTIPGHIEAEAFNDGGEGVAYHDNDTGNNGGVYRDTDVDIDFDSSPERNAYYVGWTEAGEWLAYTASVEVEGYYLVEAYVASDGTGGTFHVELNGVDITGPMSIPNTGGWRNWQGVSKTNIYLTPVSDATLRIVLDAIGPSGSVGNIDFVRFHRQDAPTP